MTVEQHQINRQVERWDATAKFLQAERNKLEEETCAQSTLQGSCKGCGVGKQNRILESQSGKTRQQHTAQHALLTTASAEEAGLYLARLSVGVWKRL